MRNATKIIALNEPEAVDAKGALVDRGAEPFRVTARPSSNSVVSTAWPGRATALAPQAIRELFDVPDGDIYLSCASRAPLARRTFEVGVQATALKKLPWTLTTGDADSRIRALFAELINCAPEDVALCPSTSFALMTAARYVATTVSPGDIGIILEDQMSSNTYPWQLLQDSHGLALEAIPYPSDGDWTRALLTRIDKLDAEGRRVAVVAVPVYLWTDGSGPIDIAAVSSVCRKPGRAMSTMLVVDATQSVGAVPIDVHSTHVDFLAASVHKWLFGAYGLSCLYVARNRWEDVRLRPLVEDEHSRAHMANPDDEAHFDSQLPGYPTEFFPGARRLDNGGRPNPIILPMAADGLELVKLWNPVHIAAALEPVTRRIHEYCVCRLGLWVPTHHGPHFLGVGPGAEDRCITKEQVAAWVADAAAYLKRRRIYVTARLKVLRVAPHLYTSVEDVDQFLEALSDFVRERRKSKASSRL